MKKRDNMKLMHNFVYYCTYDINIMALLKSFGFDSVERPTPASTILIELYYTPNDKQYGVKAYYNGKEFTFPVCKLVVGICTYSKVKRYLLR